MILLPASQGARKKCVNSEEAEREVDTSSQGQQERVNSEEAEREVDPVV